MLDLPFRTPSASTTMAFLAVVVFVGACVVLAAGESRRRQGATVDMIVRGRRAAMLGLLAWLALTAALPASGLLALAPPALAGFGLLSLCAALGLGLSPEGRRWADHLPLWALVGFQAFRLPLELVLHAWFEEGSIPVEMTWDGSNLDVVSGLVALGAGLSLWWQPNKLVAWVATALGSVLLLNVVRVAMLSAPMPLPGSFHADPPLLLALHAPYAWIVSMCVAGALTGHVVTVRRLLSGAP